MSQSPSRPYLRRVLDGRYDGGDDAECVRVRCQGGEGILVEDAEEAESDDEVDRADDRNPNNVRDCIVGLLGVLPFRDGEEDGPEEDAGAKIEIVINPSDQQNSAGVNFLLHSTPSQTTQQERASHTTMNRTAHT